MADPKKFNRRRFLITAGSVVGASALCCTGAGFLAMQQPSIDFIEEHYSKENSMGKKVLIAYASKCGSTGEVAEAVGKILAQSGAVVDVKRVQEIKDARGYDAVVIGSAARMGKLLPEAVKFAQKQQAVLAGLPTAYFAVCSTMNTDTPANRQTVSGYIQPLVEARKPIADLGMFGGKVDYSKMEWIFRMMFSGNKGGEMAEGDWRDWNAINAWVVDVAQKMWG